MITFVKKGWSDKESLECLDEDVRKWFRKNFKALTPPQNYSFKLISENQNVLITAPTGSGKTFSAFMVILSELFKYSKKGKLENSVYCIYVSPLRALDNDIYKNLLVPLKEISKNISKDEIRVGIRTGDISPSEKQKQLKKTPHILITTPESIAIILNSRKFVEKLRSVRWLVIDEIHELASNKRGVHLSLSIERLEELVGREIVRIGLGATLHPLEEAAKFLVGYNFKKMRNCKVVDVSWFKPFDLELISPSKDLVKISGEELNKLMYRSLEEMISRYRTTIVFTNTRSGTERVVHHLKSMNRFKDNTIEAHHGSLSREIRWDVEERLKKGLLKAVISSTSLELGIDIGYVDMVIQIGSPKSVTRCVQRIGRSGHGLLDTAKGRIICMDRDDLVECAVMLKCAKQRQLDNMQIPKNCLDVLAQHVVGMSLTKKWNAKKAFELIRKSYCYRTLDWKTFVSLLHYLAGHYADLEDRNVYGKIWFDETEKIFGRRGKYTKVIYYLNIGTIPDEVKVDVFISEPRKYVGNIEESFLERLRKNDVFQLGGRSYIFKYARGMRCYVEEAKEALPTIPAWFSELLPLSYELAIEICKFRGKILSCLMKKDKKTLDNLLLELPIDKSSRNAIAKYFQLQYDYLGKIPTDNELLIEDTYDLKGRRALVFHFLFGRRVNDALSRVFGVLIGEKINSDVGTIVSDNGFSLLLPKGKEFSIEEIFQKLYSLDLKEILESNIRNTELMKRRFRHCSARSFLVLKNYKGYKISVRKQQISSQTLLNICEEIDKEFPIIKETYREILEEVMDIKKAKEIIKRIKEGRIRYEFVKKNVPSPFAHNLIVLGEADIILMRDRKTRLLELHEQVMKALGE
ncbi:MAG: ATP-dependent helicase [Candidatus Thermoplasmatota archaeon]